MQIMWCDCLKSSANSRPLGKSTQINPLHRRIGKRLPGNGLNKPNVTLIYLCTLIFTSTMPNTSTLLLSSNIFYCEYLYVKHIEMPPG